MSAFYLSSVMIVLTLSGCMASSRESSTKQFFENTRRRSATNMEKKGIVQLRRGLSNVGCVGFVVRNEANKFLIMTARHCCFDGVNSREFSATNWCNEWGAFVVGDDIIPCRGIVAGDSRRDVVLFEAAGEVPENVEGFVLSGFAPERQTRLKMVGFPADRFAPPGPVISENCWVIDGDTASPYRNPNWQDRSGTHNCSTYGGNSGGPLLIENSTIVIGLPFTYLPDDFNNHRWNTDTPAHFAQVADFVSTHRTTLEDLGVVIVDSQGEVLQSTDYLAAGPYSSDELPSCRFRVIPIYGTSTRMSQIEIIYDCGTNDGSMRLSCDNGSCTDRRRGVSVRDIDNRGFTYVRSNGDLAYFRRW